MTKYLLFFLLSFCVTACAASQKITQSPEPETEKSPALVSEFESMMVPDNAQKTSNGYVYVFLKQGIGVRPDHNDAVKLHLRVLDLEGKVVDEDDATVAVAHSTPFIEEMLSVMELGSAVRVWGESQNRIWEIEMLSVDETFKAPDDVAAAPDSALVLDGFDGVRYRVIESGSGANASSGDALRVQASRWKSTGEILESNRNSLGMIVVIDAKSSQLDPVHNALLQHMNPGSHVRIWIPADQFKGEYDLVEDMWLVEALPMLSTPRELEAPEENVIKVAPGTFMRFREPGDTSVAEKLVENDIAEVEMNCWNAQSGELVDSSYLRGRHEQMDIKPELGVWFDIMKHAAPGQEFTAWIKSDALPEQVGMDLVCKVHVYNRVEVQGTIAQENGL